MQKREAIKTAFRRLIFIRMSLFKSSRDCDLREIDYTLQDKFYLYLLLEKGIHISSNRIIFLPTAHKKEHIEKITQSTIGALEYFAEVLTVFQ